MTDRRYHGLHRRTFRITYPTEPRADGTTDVFFEEFDDETGEVIRSHYREMMREWIDVWFDDKEPEGAK